MLFGPLFVLQLSPARFLQVYSSFHAKKSASFKHNLPFLRHKIHFKVIFGLFILQFVYLGHMCSNSKYAHDMQQMNQINCSIFTFSLSVVNLVNLIFSDEFHFKRSNSTLSLNCDLLHFFIFTRPSPFDCYFSC